MKVYPAQNGQNVVNIWYQPRPVSGGSHKKLRRLPHIFNRILELPFRSDADVSVEEKSDCFRFMVETEDIGEVSARLIEIHPGVIKIIVTQNGDRGLSDSNDLELDIWRFRLPETTLPELATAVLFNRELVVTVPKRDEGDGVENGDIGNSSNGNGNARLVIVQ